MRSGVNTPPSSRKPWSASSELRTASSEPGTCGMLRASSGGSSYRSLSTGSTGSILFLMPSRPAISIAEKAKYGLQVGEVVHRRHREVAALVARFVAQVAAVLLAPGVPGALHRVDVVVRLVLLG